MITSMEIVFVIFDRSVMNESKSDSSRNSKQITDTLTSNAIIPLGLVDTMKVTSPNSDDAQVTSKQLSADERYISASRVAAVYDNDDQDTLQDA